MAFRWVVIAVGLLTAHSVSLAASMLRIACEGDATGAMVTVNGRKMGECPLDMQVQPGDLRIRVTKPKDDESERVFEQSLYLGDRVVKRIDVSLDKTILTPLGERRRKERELEAERERARQEVLRRQQEAEAEARRLQAAMVLQTAIDEFRARGNRDCPECPELVVVPGGAFAMGSPPDEKQRQKDEGPVRQVTIKAFAMSKTHVTRAEFAQFIRETGYKPTTLCRIWDGGGLFTDPRWRDSIQHSWEDPGFPQGDDHPVVCVSWRDAQEYVAWLAKKSGKRYRLPSEAELEYAIRGGTTGRWWWEGYGPACAFENVADQNLMESVPGARKAAGWIHYLCRDGYAYTAPVAKFRPNKFGIYDALGNALQWAADCYADTYQGAASDGNPRPDLQSCTFRTARGGAWSHAGGDVGPLGRAAFRSSGYPNDGYASIGIRLARDLP